MKQPLFFFSPRWISLTSATFVSVISISFLSFLPNADTPVLFVAGVASFFSTFFFTFYIIDLLIFREVNQIYASIKKLKIKNFDISKKNLMKSVSPLKKLNREISIYVSKKEEEIDELKKMEIYRREFIADVSHELKTPIFAAQGFVHTLMDGAVEDPEVSMRFLTKAAKSLDRLDALVRDLLVLTQVESGDLKMQLQNVDLVEICIEIFEQLEGRARSRATNLSLKPKGLKLAKVWADPQRIRQVMTNLIDNAIKYGKDEGEVVVRIETESKTIKVNVEDDGQGIPQTELPRVFERFYRVDKSRSRETGGTGLGLAIVKHILSAHDSTITVYSKNGKGTTFSFELTRPPK